MGSETPEIEIHRDKEKREGRGEGEERVGVDIQADQPEGHAPLM
jgi:hypothetical protein